MMDIQDCCRISRTYVHPATKVSSRRHHTACQLCPRKNVQFCLVSKAQRCNQHWQQHTRLAAGQECHIWRQWRRWLRATIAVVSIAGHKIVAQAAACMCVLQREACGRGLTGLGDYPNGGRGRSRNHRPRAPPSHRSANARIAPDALPQPTHPRRPRCSRSPMRASSPLRSCTGRPRTSSRSR